MIEWVKNADKRPEPDGEAGEYLIVVNLDNTGQRVTMGLYVKDWGEWFEQPGCDDLMMEDVTHWAPINYPEGP